MAVYCDECAQPVSPDSAFYTEDGGALCPEHAPPTEVEIKVDVKYNALCPECGHNTLRLSVIQSYTDVLFKVDIDGNGCPAYSVHSGDPAGSDPYALYCSTCGFSVDLRVTNIVYHGPHSLKEGHA